MNKKLADNAHSEKYSIQEYAIGSVSNRNHFNDNNYKEELICKKDCFKSLFRYPNNLVNKLESENTNSIAGYNGLVWADSLAIDIDFKKNDGTGDIKKALPVSRNILRYLETTFEINLSNIQIKFSGNKGFHIIIPSIMFGGFEPSTSLSSLHKEIVRKLTEGFDGVDYSIYRNTALFRIENTINSKSNLFSIPLSYKDIFSLDYKEIVDLAKRPNLNYELIESDELIENQLLVELKESLLKKVKTVKVGINNDNNDNIILPLEYWGAMKSRCFKLNEIITKSKRDEEISNAERFLVGTLASKFGKGGRLIVHEIMSTQKNYSAEVTDYQFNQIFDKEYKPIKCENICDKNCRNIELVNRNSPIAFARKIHAEYNQTIAVSEVKKYFKSSLLYKTESKTFYLYNGSYFEEIDDMTVSTLFESFLQLFFPPEEITETKITALVKRISICEEFVYRGDMNPHLKILNVKNGMLDLETMELKNHSPEYKSTVQLNVEYDPDAKCELFSEKLNEIFDDDDDSINTLLQYMLYSILPTYQYQKILILYGSTGRNGKGLLAEIMVEILTANHAAFENFSDLAGDKHYSLIHLKDKLINISSELSSKEAHTDVIKRLCGGDYLSTREIYKGKVQFRNIARLWILTNGLPRVTNLDKAFLARLIILHFPKSFADNPDTELASKLKKELSGIFNLIISKRNILLRKDGSIKLEIPKSIEANVDKYMFHFHSVAEFIHDNCEVYNSEKHDVEYGVLLSCIYKRYREWCEDDAGYKPVGKKVFKEVLTSISKCEVQNINYAKSLAQNTYKSQNWVIGVRLLNEDLYNTAYAHDLRSVSKNKNLRVVNLDDPGPGFINIMPRIDERRPTDSLNSSSTKVILS